MKNLEKRGDNLSMSYNLALRVVDHTDAVFLIRQFKDCFAEKNPCITYLFISKKPAKIRRRSSICF